MRIPMRVHESSLSSNTILSLESYGNDEDQFQLGRHMQATFEDHNLVNGVEFENRDNLIDVSKCLRVLEFSM